MHHKAYVEINKVPTCIETWDRWIEEKSNAQNQDIIIFIPGNPGLTGFYKIFLENMYEKLQCPVWIIGHAGHQQPETSQYIRVPSLKNNPELYTTQGQIDHKVDFFRKYVPSNARVHLIGHSIGAYICLNLLKHSDIKSKVENAYLLFPTIENMAVSPNGRFLITFIKPIVPIIVFLSWIFTCLPSVLQQILLYIYCTVTFYPTEKIPTTIELIKPRVLSKVFYMAMDEMDTVQELDPELINNAKDKIKLYYGATDNWAPASYCEKLLKKYPGIKAEICVRGFQHAFVIHSSADVANMTSSWIQLKSI